MGYESGYLPLYGTETEIQGFLPTQAGNPY